MHTYEICRCGNPEYDHPFLHRFTPTAKITRNNNTFTLDANDYPEKTREKCAIPDCVIDKELHTEEHHTYVPLQYTYREVNICLPNDLPCKTCTIPLIDHESVETRVTQGTHDTQVIPSHIFLADVKVLNRRDTDKVTIMCLEDEDIKISIE